MRRGRRRAAAALVAFAAARHLAAGWGLDAFRAAAPAPAARAGAAAAAAALAGAGYSARALRERVLAGTPAAAAAAPTQVLRRDAAPGPAPPRADEVDALIALLALGLPVRAGELGAATRAALAPLLVVEDAAAAAAATLRSAAMVAPVAVGALGGGGGGGELYVATDWPPPRSALGGDAEPCMYVGPDSAALADCAAGLLAARPGARVADLCAGSGVQGLVAARRGAAAVAWVEAQPRAAAFCRLNAALNGVAGSVRRAPVAAAPAPAGGPLDLVLANPPYVAAPPAARYEAFADGGADGYAVLADCAAFAARALAPAGARPGALAAVLELNGPPDALAATLRAAWRGGGGGGARAALVVDAASPRTAPAAAAGRRGGAAAAAWRAHYAAHGVDRVANAVLVLARAPGDGFAFDVAETPRAWAPPPTNVEARAAVARAAAWAAGGA